MTPQTPAQRAAEKIQEWADNSEYIELNREKAIQEQAQIIAAEYAKESPWRPISEAPKDGTAVLLWTSDGVVAGRWDDRVKAFKCYFGMVIYIYGTHFMPLPEPPTDQNAALEGGQG